MALLPESFNPALNAFLTQPPSQVDLAKKIAQESAAKAAAAHKAALAQAENAGQGYNQLATAGEGVPAQITGMFDEAAGKSEAFAQGFSQAFQSETEKLNQQQQELLRKQTGDPNASVPGNKLLGDASMFLGGLPASVYRTQGAGLSAAAALQPDLIRSQGLQAVQTAKQAETDAYAKLLADLQEKRGTSLLSAQKTDTANAFAREKADTANQLAREKLNARSSEIDVSLTKLMNNGKAYNSAGKVIGRGVPVEKQKADEVDVSLTKLMNNGNAYNSAGKVIATGVPISEPDPVKIDVSFTRLMNDGKAYNSAGEVIGEGVPIKPLKKESPTKVDVSLTKYMNDGNIYNSSGEIIRNGAPVKNPKVASGGLTDNQILRLVNQWYSGTPKSVTKFYKNPDGTTPRDINGAPVTKTTTEYVGMKSYPEAYKALVATGIGDYEARTYLNSVYKLGERGRGWILKEARDVLARAGLPVAPRIINGYPVLSVVQAKALRKADLLPPGREIREGYAVTGEGEIPNPNTPPAGGRKLQSRVDVPSDASPFAKGLLAEAEQFLGTPYSWGGGGPGGPSYGIEQGAKTKGFDCSSFAQYLYAKAGISIPRTTYEQWKVGTPVGKDELQPGDLVFFHPGSRGPEHEGIYVGNNQFLEAPYTGQVVRVSDMSKRDDFMGGRRING